MSLQIPYFLYRTSVVSLLYFGSSFGETREISFNFNPRLVDLTGLGMETSWTKMNLITMRL